MEMNQGGFDDRQAAAPRPRPEAAPRACPGLGGVFLRSCLVAGCAAILTPILLFSSLVVIAWLAIGSGLPDGESSLRQVTLREGANESGDIAIVRIQGKIDGAGSPLDGDGMLADVAEQLRAAARDDRVKAVLLQIDSPGGGFAASDQIYHEVANLRRGGKTVLAWAGGLMASGGYYIAAAAAGIMANPAATVGSIGVIMNHFEVGDALRSLGITVDPITSGAHKDIGSPFREMTPDERKLLQAHVDALHRRFVAIVAKGRNIPPERVGELAGGDIFGAEAAMANGLVDRIGYIEDALDWVGELAGVRNMRVIGYRHTLSLGKLLREAGQGAAAAFREGLLPGNGALVGEVK
ncbi:MAG: signal peptide peptidase SppA [Planctomycetota bacterium]|nr:signal peptide peptidase SppA [Planctomycetota bacterium]